MKLIITTAPFQEPPTAEAIRQVFNSEETLSEYVHVFHTVGARTVRVNFHDEIAAEIVETYAEALAELPTIEKVKIR